MKCWVNFVAGAGSCCGVRLKRGCEQAVGAFWFLAIGGKTSLARRVEECFEHLWKGSGKPDISGF